MADDTVIVLVAGEEDLLNNIRDALSETNLALLHAQTKAEALALLERLRSEINLAIVELEMADFGGWDLIRRLTYLPNKPLKIIATTSRYPETFFPKIKETGVDAVVEKAIPTEAWRRTVETVLGASTQA
jgi:CheY-like chemotaxis protein